MLRVSRTAVETVADAMIHRPKVLSGDALVGEVQRLFADDHVHVALIVQHGRLVTVIERTDVQAASRADGARNYGRLEGRITCPDAPLPPIWQRMREERQRRLAVVDRAGVLQGLLCLKKTGAGFCSDKDVLDRSLDVAAQRGRIDLLTPRQRAWPVLAQRRDADVCPAASVARNASGAPAHRG